MSTKLIGIDICPYVLRCLIMLHLGDVEFEKKFFDPPNKPDWFLKISPTGKVPVLEFDGVYIFESLVINEFLNEKLNLHLQVPDPIEKAINRCWSEYSSTLLTKVYSLVRAVNKTDFEQLADQIKEGLRWLETTMIRLPYFNGDNLALIDIAFAPLFFRLRNLNENYSMNFFMDTPTVRTWSSNVLKNESIANSIPENYPELLNQSIQKHKGFLSL